MAKRMILKIDGREMTLADMAAEMGISQKHLMYLRRRLKTTYRWLWERYRNGEIRPGQGRYKIYHIGHAWLTIDEAAERAGVTKKAFYQYYYRQMAKGRPVSMGLVIRHYLDTDKEQRRSKGAKRREARRGRKKYEIHGETLILREASEKYGVSISSIYYRMRHKDETAEQAVDAILAYKRRVEDNRYKAAEKRLVRIMMDDLKRRAKG